MGGSGCGKSTLLNHMVGLVMPAKGDVFYDAESLSRAVGDERDRLRRRFGPISTVVWMLPGSSSSTWMPGSIPWRLRPRPRSRRHRRY